MNTNNELLKIKTLINWLEHLYDGIAPNLDPALQKTAIVGFDQGSTTIILNETIYYLKSVDYTHTIPVQISRETLIVWLEHFKGGIDARCTTHHATLIQGFEQESSEIVLKKTINYLQSIIDNKKEDKLK